MNYEELLKRGPYELGAEEKKKIYADMLSELTDSHRKRCLIYDRCCSALGDVSGSQRREEEIPMVPVSMFKEMELRSVPTGAVFKTVTSSGTTGQKTSKIVLDERTAAWQQQTLQRIMGRFYRGKADPDADHRRAECPAGPGTVFREGSRDSGIFNLRVKTLLRVEGRYVSGS